MRINFVMPFKAKRPAGGFRVMYEYANRLSDLGYSVHITYPVKTKYMVYRLPYFIRLFISYIEGSKAYNWFKFRPNITMSTVKSITDKSLIDADIIIVTWWTTVTEVGKLSEYKGKKINLIQGYEDWEGHVDELHQSYDIRGMYNIVVAKYLIDIVSKYTDKPIKYIPNSIDREQFREKIPAEVRNPISMCMLYSIQEIKGSKYGLEALNIVHEYNPDIKVDLFGICPKPENLPTWIKYYHDYKDLSEIYNNNALFISNSLTEGFGLVSIEAMSCGCALICTDIQGHKEYAVNEYNALLVEPKNAKELAEKIIFLIENNEYRIKLARQGNISVQEYSWDVSVKKMDGFIQKILSK